MSAAAVEQRPPAPVEKTHYRKAFDSPYLSSADIVEPTVLTIARVTLEADRTKKTKDLFNTAWFAEKEIRKGEKLKPMILNATNSKTLRLLTGSAFLEDWRDVAVTVYVDHNVKFGKESVEGLRISPKKPAFRRDDPAREQLVRDLYEKAAEGLAALRPVWTGLTEEQRKAVGGPEWSRIKEAAERNTPPADLGQRAEGSAQC